MTDKSEKNIFLYHFVYVINILNFVPICDGEVVRLVDLIWNDPVEEKGAPIGIAIIAHPSRLMTGENFNLFFKHFIKYSKCNKDFPVLIITGLLICKANGITLLTLPPPQPILAII